MTDIALVPDVGRTLRVRRSAVSPSAGTCPRRSVATYPRSSAVPFAVPSVAVRGHVANFAHGAKWEHVPFRRPPCAPCPPWLRGETAVAVRLRNASRASLHTPTCNRGHGVPRRHQRQPTAAMRPMDRPSTQETVGARGRRWGRGRTPRARRPRDLRRACVHARTPVNRDRNVYRARGRAGPAKQRGMGTPCEGRWGHDATPTLGVRHTCERTTRCSALPSCPHPAAAALDRPQGVPDPDLRRTALVLPSIRARARPAPRPVTQR